MSKYGLEMILPKELQENFELKKVKEKSTEWILYLTEKKTRYQQKHNIGQAIVRLYIMDT